jgi:hypothetical protein
MEIGKRTLIFLHIHKTGGNTLRRIVERQYDKHLIWRVYKQHKPNDLQKLSQSERARIRLIVGHFKFGYHELLPQPSTYITFLREPVERVISNYIWTLANENHAYHRRVVSQTSDLIEYIHSGIDPIVSNGMTKMLSGRGALYGDNPRELVERAKTSVDNHFAVVGLTEMFDESLLLLSHIFGWRNIFYVKRNVTKKRIQSKDVSKTAKDTIRQYNRLDLELYQYVLEKFERTIAQQDPLFFYKLRLFQVVNRFYGTAYKPARSIYHTLKRMQG